MKLQLHMMSLTRHEADKSVHFREIDGGYKLRYLVRYPVHPSNISNNIKYANLLQK